MQEESKRINWVLSRKTVKQIKIGATLRGISISDYLDIVIPVVAKDDVVKINEPDYVYMEGVNDK